VRVLEEIVLICLYISLLWTEPFILDDYRPRSNPLIDLATAS
jgi:hypothetical protein